MYLLYRGLTWLACALVPPYALASLLRRPGRWRELGDRLALFPTSLRREASGAVWIQAASVGELELARLLAPALAAARPGLRLVVSVTTPAARSLLAAPLPGVAATFTFPLDLPPVVARAVRQLHPRLFIALETEIWPNLFEALRQRSVPVALVNGRISDASLARYRRLPGLLARALAAVRLVCARTPRDAERFQELGVAGSRVAVCGDLKFDRRPPTAGDLAPDLAARLRGRRVLVAGSTHPGEEEVVLAAARGSMSAGPLTVVLAPRHLERLAEVERLLAGSGLPWQRRTALASAGPVPDPVEVLLLDTHGELASLYPAAQVAFLGGTLAPVGGHNPLEAAAAGVPLVAGPRNANIAGIAAALEEAGGLLTCAGAEACAEHLARLLTDPDEARHRGEAARRAAAAGAGALQRCLERLAPLLPSPATGAEGT